jgi:hypothetical protein
MVLVSVRNTAGWFWQVRGTWLNSSGRCQEPRRLLLRVPGTQQNISAGCQECDRIILADARNKTEWFWQVAGMPQDGFVVTRNAAE